MKVEIPLYDGSEQKPKFDFVHCQNHTQEITGLDVCIRKQLIVTCSKDRSVKIWNYVNKTLEITQNLAEEALAVAFHPSGFHIVVAIQDKILLMNVLSKSLHLFKNIQVK
jgi:WD40 repeat protein